MAPLIRAARNRRGSGRLDSDERPTVSWLHYVLAHAPEFVAGRKAAEDRFARGELGQQQRRT